MDKRVIIYPAATLATAALVTIASYNANRADTKVAPPEDPNAVVRTEPVQMHAFDLYGQGEDFQYNANFLIDRIGMSINQEEIDSLWPEVAEAQKRALDAYTDAIRADSNSHYADLARARIMGFYIDPVFQEAEVGDVIHAGEFSFRVYRKESRSRVEVDGREGYTTAKVGFDIYRDGRKVGTKQISLSPPDWKIKQIIEEYIGN